MRSHGDAALLEVDTFLDGGAGVFARGLGDFARNPGDFARKLGDFALLRTVFDVAAAGDDAPVSSIADLVRAALTSFPDPLAIPAFVALSIDVAVLRLDADSCTDFAVDVAAFFDGGRGGAAWWPLLASGPSASAFTILVRRTVALEATADDAKIEACNGRHGGSGDGAGTVRVGGTEALAGALTTQPATNWAGTCSFNELDGLSVTMT
jgi:hypothetical protein